MFFLKEKTAQKLLLWLLFLIFTGSQLFFIATSCIISDNALVGIAAQKILKGEFLTFLPGQDYMGTLEAYSTALIFKIFGGSVFTLQLAPFFFAFLFLLAIYYLAQAILGRKPALLAVLFLVFGPPYFHSYAHASRGGYIEALFLGTWLFFITYRIVWSDKKSPKTSYFLFGLIAGLGFWTNPMTVSYLAVSVFFVFLKNKKFFRSSDFLLSLAAFFLGSAPFWIYNLKNNFAALSFLTGQAGFNSLGLIRLKFFNVFFSQLPKILNLKFDGNLKWFGFFILGIFVFIYFYFLWQKRKNLKNIFRGRFESSDGTEMILLFIPLVLFLCLMSNYGVFNVPRYSLPLYSAYPLMLAAFFKENWPKFKYPLIIFASAILILNTTGLIKKFNPQIIQINKTNNQSSAELIDFLVKNNLTSGYADYWLSERLTFLSNQQVIFCAFDEQRHPEFALSANADKNPAFIFTGRHYFGKALEAAGSQYQKGRLEFPTPDPFFNLYIIFYNFSPPLQSFREILPDDFKIIASCQQKNALNIFDRKITTAWSTQKPAKPGDFLVIDLKQSCLLGKIEWLPEEYSKLKGRTLGGFEIFTSPDGQNWTQATKIKEITAPVFWSGPRPVWPEENGRVSLVFEPVKTRFIKIVQTKKSSKNLWSIRELFLYSPDDRRPDRDFKTDRLLDFLNQKSPQLVVCDYWLSSTIAFLSNSKIKTIRQFNEIPYNEKSSQKNYRELAIGPKTIFVIRPDEAQALETSLQKIALDFKKIKIDSWLVYHDLNPLSCKNLKFFWDGTHLLETAATRKI